MEAAIKFAVSSEKMDIITDLVNNGHLIPAALFVDTLTEKCQLLNTHVRQSRETLMITASITDSSATIQIHDLLFTDSEFHRVTLSNLPNLEDQLIYLWTEMRNALQLYQIDDLNAELSHIDTYYQELDYNQMMAADFML